MLVFNLKNLLLVYYFILGIKIHNLNRYINLYLIMRLYINLRNDNYLYLLIILNLNFKKYYLYLNF